MVDDDRFPYLRVRAEKGGVVDLFRFLVSNAKASEFLDSSEEEKEKWGPVSGDHRWVIVVSIIARKIIAFLGKPMEWNGVLVEFLLNLLSLNGGIRRLFLNLLTGKVMVPQRGSDTFISAIGHLDPRVDLFKGESSLSLAGHDEGTGEFLKIGNRAPMDLCIMASKLAYENANVVEKIIINSWKMHFVAFYNCWDDYQKERSTQVFILCDKPKDATLVLISFRGTEPFDADDWSTDFDYSWYDIPKLGKVHMGFLEALGLGNRTEQSTIHARLQPGARTLKATSSTSPSSTENRYSAYYAVRTKLETLLDEHKKAQFIVTGHSLGGALAILFPAMLLLHEEEKLMERLLGVYTFGQPRVGDSQLKSFMEAHLSQPVPKYFRVVYCNDLVPRLPYDDNTFLYKHFGMCLYYNSLYVGQNMSEAPNRNYFGLRYLLPGYLNAVWEFIRSLIMGNIYGAEYKESWFSILLRVVGLALPGLSAHSPTNYVNCIRLGRMDQMGTV